MLDGRGRFCTGCRVTATGALISRSVFVFQVGGGVKSWLHVPAVSIQRGGGLLWPCLVPLGPLGSLVAGAALFVVPRSLVVADAAYRQLSEDGGSAARS